MKEYNVVGQKFGMLTVLQQPKGSRYIVKCDCGNVKKANKFQVRHQQIKSCGCSSSPHQLIKGVNSKKYRRERNIWSSMMARCYKSKHNRYQYYGGKGITVCERWHIFENFFNDMGKSNGLSIDRINFNGNYELRNCRWANAITQSRNRGHSEIVEFQGIKHSKRDWAIALNIPLGTLRKRFLKKEWPLSKILSPINYKLLVKCFPYREMRKQEEEFPKQPNIKLTN